MAHVEVAERRSVRGLANQANPAFAAGAVLVPIGALVAVLLVGDIRLLNYVHVMTGGLWTGIDLFMGLVIGPVMAGLDPESRAAFFQRFTPKLTFLMPVLSLTTIVAGITLAGRLGYFTNPDPWLALLSLVITIPAILLIAYQFDVLTHPWTLGILAVVAVGSGGWFATTYATMTPVGPLIHAALGIVVLLSIIGFGLILPSEVKIYLQIASPEPDTDLIGRLGLRNAKLGGVQGLLQLSIIFVMASLRFGL